MDKNCPVGDYLYIFHEVVLEQNPGEASGLTHLSMISGLSHRRILTNGKSLIIQKRLDFLGEAEA